MASFGPILKHEAVVSVIIQKNMKGLLSFGCNPSDYQNTNGKFSMIKRGSCTFVEKSIAAEKGGASGLIIGNTMNKAFLMTNIPGDPGDFIKIPVMMMTKENAISLVKLVKEEREVRISPLGILVRQVQHVMLYERRISNMRIVEHKRDVFSVERDEWMGFNKI